MFEECFCLVILHSLRSSGATTMMSEGTKNIVEGMKARGIRKVVGCLSGTANCRRQGCKKILHLSFVVIFLDTFYIKIKYVKRRMWKKWFVAVVHFLWC